MVIVGTPLNPTITQRVQASGYSREGGLVVSVCPSIHPSLPLPSAPSLTYFMLTAVPVRTLSLGNTGESPPQSQRTRYPAQHRSPTCGDPLQPAGQGRFSAIGGGTGVGWGGVQVGWGGVPVVGCRGGVPGGRVPVGCQWWGVPGVGLGWGAGAGGGVPVGCWGWGWGGCQSWVPVVGCWEARGGAGVVGWGCEARGRAGGGGGGGGGGWEASGGAGEECWGW